MGSNRGEGTYNVVVIGAGTTGLLTAEETAALGGRVALVERGRMGGNRLNTGWVPTKALISSARLADRIRHAERWGLTKQEPRFEFASVIAHMRERRARIAPHRSPQRLESLGVDVFRGEARFLSPREVQVDGATLRARNFVIATGSRPTIPDVPGLPTAPYFTSENVFDELDDRPARLLVLGEESIGCELGQAFARLGVQVTVVQRGTRILPEEDEDAGEVVRARLVADGVRILAPAKATLAVGQERGVRVWVESSGGREAIDCEALLVAAGRTANVDGLGLESAGVAFTPDGITVDDRLRTSQPHIFAAGRVTGFHRSTHTAGSQARTIVRNVLFPWFPARAQPSAISRCTATSPELARIGLSEQEAREKGIPYDVFRTPLAELDRAVVESEEEGFAKIVVAKGTDRILGATIVAERAGDLIAELALAMNAGIGLKRVGRTGHSYPGFAEIVRLTTGEYRKKRLTPAARRLFAWLYRRARGG